MDYYKTILYIGLSTGYHLIICLFRSFSMNKNSPITNIIFTLIICFTILVCKYLRAQQVDIIFSNNTWKVKENVKEDTNNLVIQIIWDELKVDVNIDDLDRNRRVGSFKNSNSKTRPITVNFARYDAKSIVFNNKKQLKSKYISITESLTKLRMKKLQEVREIHGRLKVLTYVGRMVFKSEEMIKVFYDLTIFSWQKRHQ